MATPSARAAAGSAPTTGRPSNSIVPASGATAPAMIFTSVLLPAPFSPRMAWISPAATSSETPSLAVTPG
jgi:hypothetical protein